MQDSRNYNPQMARLAEKGAQKMQSLHCIDWHKSELSRQLACQDNQQKAPKKAKDAKGSSKDPWIFGGLWKKISAQWNVAEFFDVLESGNIHDVGWS